MIALAAFLVGALVLAGLGAVLSWRVDRRPMDLPGSAEGGTTYLLIGSDERTAAPTEDVDRFGTPEEVGGRRADIVVAVRVDDDGSVRVLGVPRDLIVLPKGKGPQRLATLLQGGAGELADGLCNSLGLGVDHVAEVRFDGLQDLVDHAGGVDVETDAALRDPMSGVQLRKGRNRLDGREALAYVRARNIETLYAVTWTLNPERSAQRSERAVEVLEGLSGRLPTSWTDPLGTFGTAWTASGAVTVDDGTGPLDLIQLKDATDGIRRSSMQTVPVDATGGPVPTAALAAEAGAVIDDFNGPGRNDACDRPVLLAGG